MVYDKNFFLNQLRNGQDVNAMGQAMADAMNAAIADYTAEQEAARKAQAEKVAKAELTAKKKAIGEEIVDLFREYSDLIAPGAMDGLEITDDDLDTLIEALDQTFALMGAVKELKTAIDALPEAKPKRAKTDDEALADFLATIIK